MLWEMEAEAGIREHLLYTPDESHRALTGWLTEGPATWKSCFRRTSRSSCRHPPHSQAAEGSTPSPFLPLSRQIAFCLSVQQALSQLWEIEAAYPSGPRDLSFNPGLTRDSPWSLSLQNCPVTPFWGLLSHDPDVSSHLPLSPLHLPSPISGIMWVG